MQVVLTRVAHLWGGSPWVGVIIAREDIHFFGELFMSQRENPGQGPALPGVFVVEVGRASLWRMSRGGRWNSRVSLISA